MAGRPEWWSWELRVSGHLLDRMLERGFSETDLRVMLDCATGFRRSREPGRWVVETSHDSCPWEVVVEPNPNTRTLLVITAFPLDRP
ncbi:MAG: DUF4258 domain-containing protein [Planctomycetes bacterium]|nr:DUF4258 domain-containing protein [Planctomycetota bacterium]